MHRHLVPEMMDDPNLGPQEHQRALKGLRRLNAWTYNANLAWRYIRSSVSEQSPTPVTILDVATGSADVPIALFKRSAANGIAVDISASDISEQALDFAREECDRQSADVKLFAQDVVAREIPGEYNIVMCSQFLHHLPDNDVVDVLRKMRTAATQRVVVIDLLRSRLNLWQVWLATRILSRSPIVHFDGPQSIRAAFTLDEFERLALEAGFTKYQLAAKWPCRFIFSGEVDGSE